MRPTDWDNFVGQTRAKTQLEILQSSALTRNAAIPHLLFSGNSGTGKTTCSRILSYSRNYHEFNAASLKNVGDMIKVLERLKENDVLFIDEIHALPSKIQESLYIVMEDFEYEKGMKRIKLKPFTLIGATTHVGSLNKPLQQRFKHIIEFVEYTVEEMALIVQRVAKSNLGLELSDKFARLVAQTCRNNPRNTIRRTEWIRDCIIHEAKNSSIAAVCKSITPEKLFQMIEGQGVDKYGLEDIEKRYLNILAESTEPMSINSVASKLGVIKENILNDIEPYLVKIGLVNIGNRGRSIDLDKYREMYSE